MIKQRQLLKDLYAACLAHDDERISELQKEEYQKIFDRKARGKKVSKPKFTLIR